MKLSRILLAALTQASCAATLTPEISSTVNRPWLGPDFWANPAEDWNLRAGRLENSFSGGNRNAVILTSEINDSEASFTAITRVDQASFDLKGPGFAGFQIGLATPSGDYREAAVRGTGFCAGLTLDGIPFIGDVHGSATAIQQPFRNLTLDLRAEPSADKTYRLVLTVSDPSGKKLGDVATAVHPSWLHGLVAVAASAQAPPKLDLAAPRPAVLPPLTQDRTGDACFRFDAITLSGDKITLKPNRSLGPILWTTQLPTNDGRISLLLQAAPYGREERKNAVLFVDGKESTTVTLDPSSRTARFNIRRTDPTHDRTFEIRLDGSSWKGTIRTIPHGRPLILAALCGDDSSDFTHPDIIANVLAHKPDMIAFLGNQADEDAGGYGFIVDQHPNERTLLSYFRKYCLHGWAWRDALRDIPSVTLPSDHDVFQNKLWGEAGKAADVAKGYGTQADDSGGFKMSAEFVNVVHETQTGNLPPPVDPSPCSNHISVYFTDWAYGPIHFAALADREFRSAPKAFLKSLPGADIHNGFPSSSALYASPPPSHPDAQLLGARQENFLSRWAENRPEGTKFRVLLSQSTFSALETIPKRRIPVTDSFSLPPLAKDEYPPDDIPSPDFNANAWPQPKRNLAVQILKKAGAIHISGGSAPAATGQYATESFGDGAWWINTPPASSRAPLRWTPSADGLHRRPGDPKWLGDFSDAFGNKFTLHAVANPISSGQPTAAVGYAIVTFDPASGHVTMANWPHSSSPAKAAPHNAPFPGWPVTIDPASGHRVN